jgi:DNA-binding beta-propeller fold protein YncE
MSNKGALTLASTYALAAGAKPYGLAASPDSNNLYVVNSGATTLAQLAIGADGTLSAVAAPVTTTGACRCVTVAPDGLNVYATSANGYLYTFSRAANGLLTMPVARISANMTWALGVAVSPDNNHIYVACNTGLGVRIFSRNLGNNGQPTEIGNVAVPGARAVVVTPDGTGVYVSTDSGSPNLVYCFTRDPATGLLVAASSPTIASPSNFGNAITCSDDSAFVYVANDSGNMYTGCYSRNTSTNVLTDIGHHAAINGGVWSMALSRDSGNTSLYLAASDSQKIYQYDRSTSDLTNGGLTAKTPAFASTSNTGLASPQGGGSAGPYGIVVTPNNKFMFATAIGTDSVDVFTIDQGTATTTPVSTDFPGTFDVRATVTKDMAGSFDVLARLSADFPGSFDVRATVQRDFAGSFDVRSNVVADFPGSFDIQATGSTTITVDFPGTFDVLAGVSRDFVGTFDVRQLVTRDFVGAFDVVAQVVTITVPATRTAVFAAHSRVAVFTDTAPVSLTKVAADQLYFVGDFTKPLADGATTADSVAPIASGIAVLEVPVIQGALCVAKLGTLDPAGGQFTFRVTCANGEVIDGTIIFTALDDRSQTFGKDPDDHRFYAFDVSADLALSGNTSISTVQTPVASGVSSLSVPAIQGGKAIVLLGGLDLSDGTVNSCRIAMTLATSEVINRTAYFSRQDH